MVDSKEYLHGYTPEEQERLINQAKRLENILFKEIDLNKVKNLIEIGCGVGAQSEILLRRFPSLHLTGVDVSDFQLKKAKDYLNSKGYSQERFRFANEDATNLSFADETFDGAYFCWVLEHVKNPLEILKETKRALKPDAIIYVSEVFNHTFYTYPFVPSLSLFWNQYNRYQEEHNGDPNMGAKLGNLLQKAGYREIYTHVKSFFSDSRNEEQKKLTIQYWEELLLSAAPNLLEAGLITSKDVEAVKSGWKEISENPDSVFFCSFVQASAKA
jgi:ubiquinone/menaquinone biosynthesis C-methylase UbiE